jgi:hypothetical protein
VDHIQPGDTIYLRYGTYNENINMTRSGSQSAPITLSGYSGEEVIINGGSDMAIQASSAASYWILESLTVQSTNRYTLRLGWWDQPLTDHWIVRNNKLFGANFFIGTNSLWENNNIDGTGYSGTEGDAGITEAGTSNHNIIRKNTIHDFTNKDARGIWSEGHTHNSLIEANDISNIDAGSGEFKGQCIDLDGAGQVEWDHIVRGNDLSNCNYVGIQLENAFHTLVENNRISNIKTAGIIVINYNSNTGCKVGGDSNQYGDVKGTGDCRGVDLHTTLQQNILVNAGLLGGIISYASAGVNVYHNLIDGSTSALYIYDTADFSKNWDVRNNIFSNNSRTVISVSDPASFVKEDHNLIFNSNPKGIYEIRTEKHVSLFYPLQDWRDKFKLSQNTFEGDPLFIDPSKLDFHLQPNSPAVGAGVNLNIPTDIDGKSRPVSGATADIGPYAVGVQK